IKVNPIFSPNKLRVELRLRPLPGQRLDDIPELYINNTTEYEVDEILSSQI
ncbi:hypothetical protein BO83DRAFT_327496, partial [Aspergillus eucalypticola CBS 122712]